MPTTTANPILILSDIDHSRKRSEVLYRAQGEVGFEKSKSITKWIDIYAERLGKLERQASRLGLKTQLKTAAAAERRA